MRVGTTTAGVNTVADAITFAVHAHNKKQRNKSGPWSPWDEPPWTSPTKLLDLLVALGASNAGTVATAISQQPQTFPDLKTARNFFSHRGESTAGDVSSVARRCLVNPTLLPVEIISSRAPGRPQNLLADWLDDVRDVIEFMSF
jgi:hypothetical protein